MQGANLCNVHQQPISNLCIDNHLCDDRRLCVQCLYKTHKSQTQENTPLLEDFKNLLKDKLNQYEKVDFKPFLATIETLQKQTNQYFLEIKSQVKSLIDYLQEIDKDILSIKQKLTTIPITEFTRTEYDLMVKIIKQNVIENKKINRNSKKNICHLQIQKLAIVCNRYNSWIKVMATSITTEQIENDLQIQGQLKFGLKDGDYYYITTDGRKEYAGQYSFDTKQGLWNDNLGYDKNRWRRIFKEKMYQIGLPLGVERIWDGKFVQQTKKDGEWTEFSGKWNQIISQGHYKQDIMVGLWKDTFDGQACGEGIYDEQGYKIGKWTEPISTFNNRCSITFSGEYKNGQKVGIWTTFYKNEKIGEGLYCENGKKNGIWTDLHENFNQSNQVTLIGEYKNGVKIGKWIIYKDKNGIAGGAYDDDGLKTSNWTDLHEHYPRFPDMLFTGEYKNGKRVGEWKLGLSKGRIGGGTYNEEGEKTGKWIDLYDDFDQHHIFNVFAETFSLAMIGEYNNGFKVGPWITTFNMNQIGGGSYNEKGLKTGQWTDLNGPYCCFREIKSTGEYKNGVRIGKWQINSGQGNLGCGFYDDMGVKNGYWTEIKGDLSIQYSGDYKNGVRVGMWNIEYLNWKGGGMYDDKGFKNGYWIEEKITGLSEIELKGEYKNGVRVGQWVTTFEKNQIGGGVYDERGVKTGIWTDLHETFFSVCQVTFTGAYKNGMRVGKWTTEKQKKNIGGGTYDELGVKAGIWTDVDENFGMFESSVFEISLVLYTGEYKNGVRVGKWTQSEIF